jgi:hypothetical protein
LSYTPVHFVLVILEMGSGELLAQADLELLSSQHVFQVIRITGMSHQHPALKFPLCIPVSSLVERVKKQHLPNRIFVRIK